MTTTARKKRSKYDRIERHGEELLAIFPEANPSDPVALCKRLRRLEVRAEKLALRCCENLSMDSPEFDREHAAIIRLVHAALGSNRPWLNMDPRGYSIKIALQDGEVLHRDMGGNGVIAPDLT